jgi:alginate O-acetyltransferase complex protein AlgI
MALTSVWYLAFIVLVYLAFLCTPESLRWLTLLAASYVFLATFKAPQLLVALLLVSWVSYAAGRQLAQSTDEVKRKRLLQAGTAGCVIMLVAIRMLPFLLQSSAASVPELNLTSTLAVSYFAFQAISYVADVYLQRQRPELHFGHYALGLAFFPKLLQGPIERAGDLHPQLRKPYVFDYGAVRSGALLFTLGMFKKLVLADRLGYYVNAVYAELGANGGLPFLIATYAYALQLYFDFSGYTDMARGVGRLFGIELTENFKSPYLARSIADFWRRWHISFSRWILEYIFKPLQLSWRELGIAGTVFALLATFLLSGLWHGVTFGFIVWGLLHGSYLSASVYYRPYQLRLHRFLRVKDTRWLKAWQTVITFHLVCFAWVFFRAGSVGDAWHAIMNTWPLSLEGVGVFALGAHRRELSLLAISMAVMAVVGMAPNARHVVEALLSGRGRWFAYYALVMLILICGVFGSGEFLYARF